MSERLTKRDENENAYYDWGCLNRNHWALIRKEMIEINGQTTTKK